MTKIPKEAAPLFAALGDETRLRLVIRLCEDGPLSIARLTDELPVTRQAVTKHLRVLEAAGLAHRIRRGHQGLWKLEAKRLTAVRRYIEGISAQWDSTVRRIMNS